MLDLYKPVAEAISALLFPHAEVVLHDLNTHCIAAIFNNLSKRKVGDESLLDDLPEGDSVIPPYFKTNWDGRKTRCVSAFLKNPAGEPIGLFCINLDISKWEEMHQFILDFIRPVADAPSFLFKNDWKENINTYVTAYLKKHSLSLKSLDRTEKQKLILSLQKEGAFETKNAAALHRRCAADLEGHGVQLFKGGPCNSRRLN